MRRNVRTRLAAVAALSTLAAAFLGCGKDSPTNPPGGGGDPTLSISLTANGGTGSFTFPNAGNVEYKCGIHSAMTGNMVMVDASAPNMNATVTIDPTPSPGQFNPQHVQIRPGGTVTWENPTIMPHSVVNE